MADSDSDKRWRQVAQVYAGMTDGELKNLAEEESSLTEIGKEALKFEFARRESVNPQTLKPPRVAVPKSRETGLSVTGNLACFGDLRVT